MASIISTDDNSVADMRSTMSSTATSTGSVVKTRDGKHSVFVLCADENDTEWAEEHVIDPLEREGISCYYEERDFPLGYHVLDIIQKAVKHHPVTILPLTKEFNTRYDDSLFTLLLAENWWKDHMAICIKVEADCHVPKAFEKITNLNFAKISGDEKLRDRMRGKLTRDVKKYLERRTKKLSKRPLQLPDSKSEITDSILYPESHTKCQPTQIMSSESVVSRETEVDYTPSRVEDSRSLDYDFVAIDNLDDPKEQHIGTHVRYDVIKNENCRLEKFGVKIKLEEGIDKLISLGSEMSPNVFKRNEQYVIRREIPAHLHDGDYLSGLFKSCSENIAAAALRTYRQYIDEDVLASFYDPDTHEWSDRTKGIKSLLDSYQIISSSLDAKTSPKLAQEKTFTYREVLTAIIIGRLLGHITSDEFPTDTIRITKTLNSKLHVFTQQRAINSSDGDRRYELEYNIRVSLKCLERIGQDVDAGRKRKNPVGRISPIPSRSKLDTLSTFVQATFQDNERKRERMVSNDAFDIYFTLRHYEFAFKHSTANTKVSFLNKLQELSFTHVKKHGSVPEMHIMNLNAVFTALLENAKYDKEMCLRILHGEAVSHRLGYKSFLDEATEKSSDKLKRVLKSSLKPLIYHRIAPVAEMAQRRTVLKKSPSSDDAKTAALSIEDLDNINKDFILRSCATIALSAQSSSTPVPKSRPDTHRWMWKGEFFEETVNVLVCNYLKPSVRKSAVFGVGHETPLNQFDRELSILKKVQQHKDIINLIGFQRKPFPVFMMLENHGKNLIDFLTDRVKREELMSLRDLLNTICDPMVEAVRFCHENNVVLRDIIAKNFSIKTVGYQQFTVKYGGFELARELQPDGGKFGHFTAYESIDDDDNNCNDSDCYLGTKFDPIATRWSAPESLLAPYHFSRKTDSWMLGCALYEVLTHGCQPYTELYGMTSDEVAQHVLWGVRIKQPACIPDELHAVILGSLMVRPHRRQTVMELSEKVKRCRCECPKLGPTEISKLHPPPERDLQQPLEPDRGIPEGLRDAFGYPLALGQKEGNSNVLACQPDEITSSDEQSPVRGLYQYGIMGDYLEEKLLSSLFPSGRTRDEIDCLTHLSHPLIGRVLRFRLENDNLIQVSEYYDVKNNLLQTSLMSSNSVDTLVEQLRQVASAMTYLHSEEIGLIHCDLRASNIYVTRDGGIRVGRLGRACLLEVGLYDSGLSDSVKIRDMPKDQLRWAPLEVVRGGVYSQASDVFMFGKLCWEVFNAHSADPNTVTREMLVPYPHTPRDKIPKLLCLREHDLQPPECPDWIYILMNKCWLDERSRRPPFFIIEACLRERSLQPLDIYFQDNTENKKRRLTLVEIYKELEEEDSNIHRVYKRGNLETQDNSDHIYYTHNIAIYDTPYEARENTSPSPSQPHGSKGGKPKFVRRVMKGFQRIFKRQRKGESATGVECTYATIEAIPVRGSSLPNEPPCPGYENLPGGPEIYRDNSTNENLPEREDDDTTSEIYYDLSAKAHVGSFTLDGDRSRAAAIMPCLSLIEEGNTTDEDGYLLPEKSKSVYQSYRTSNITAQAEQQEENESINVDNQPEGDETDYNFYGCEQSWTANEYKVATIAFSSPVCKHKDAAEISREGRSSFYVEAPPADDEVRIKEEVQRLDVNTSPKQEPQEVTIPTLPCDDSPRVQVPALQQTEHKEVNPSRLCVPGLGMPDDCQIRETTNTESECTDDIFPETEQCDLKIIVEQADAAVEDTYDEACSVGTLSLTGDELEAIRRECAALTVDNKASSPNRDDEHATFV